MDAPTTGERLMDEELVKFVEDRMAEAFAKADEKERARSVLARAAIQAMMDSGWRGPDQIAEMVYNQRMPDEAKTPTLGAG